MPRKNRRSRTDAAAPIDSGELLLWKIRHEEPLAREALARKYYPMAIAAAKQSPIRLDMELKIAAAHVGLIDAIDRFQPERGLRFATWLYSVVKYRILDATRAGDHLARLDRRRTNRVTSVRSRLAHRFGRPPTIEELVEAGITADELLADRRSAPQSIQASQRGAPSNGTGEFRATNDPFQVAAPRPTPAIERCDTFLAAVSGLAYEDRSVLYLYFFERLSMREIGLVIDRSESLVSQRISAACRRLRLKGDRLRELLAG